jgi:PAS domain S-box-containing protein
MCAVARDITERQQAEAALRQSEERFRLLLKNLHVGVLVQGPQAEILLSNSQALKLLGLTEDQLLGKSSYDPNWNVVSEDGSPFLEQVHSIPQMIAARQPMRNIVIGVYHAWTKDRVWLLVNAEPQLDEEGNIKQVICTFSDISERQAALRERKAAEEKLKQQHELLQTIVDHAPVMLSLIDSQGQLQWANRAWERTLGWTAEELQHQNLFTEFYPDPTHRQLALQFIQAATGKWQDFRNQTRHGTVIDTAWANVRLSDGSNIGIGQDITERKQAEAALRQQTERERLLVSVTERIRQSLNLEEILNTAAAEVRQLLQSDRIVIYRFNPDWSGIVVAESTCSDNLSILGQLIHDPCFAQGCYRAYQQGHISAIEDTAAINVQSCYQHLLTRLGVRANLVIPILHEASLWGLLAAHYCFEPHSWQSWEIAALRQLSAQLAIAIHQSELYQQVKQFNTCLEQQVEERTKQLQQSLNFEALLKRITDKVRDSLEEAQILQTAVQELALGLGIYSCDAGLYDLEQKTSTIHYEAVQGEVPAACGRTTQMLDIPEIYAPLLQGQTLQFCWSPHYLNRIRPVAKQLTTLACPIIDHQAVLGDLWLYKAGNQCFEELEIRLVQQVANQCAIAVRQARLYEAAQLQVRELERLNQLKDDFLNTVSHELRTPMSNIRMAMQMLEVVLKPLGVLDPEAGIGNRYFQILQQECQREIDLINNLLDLSRLAAETEPLMLAAVELRLWLPHLSEPFEARIQTQQQHLSIEIPTQLPTLVTDLGHLEQILTELLHNACKYTPSGETIRIFAIEQTQGLQLSISNSGVEIPASELPHVFEKFYRVPSHDPWKYGGTGLGLALVQRRVQFLQGSIAVTSEHGWTTFTLLLPWSIETNQNGCLYETARTGYSD